VRLQQGGLGNPSTQVVAGASFRRRAADHRLVAQGKKDLPKTFQGWFRLVLFLDGLEPLEGEERKNLSGGSEVSVQARG